ncbi:MAG: nucleotide exchange factor GrpE [Gammaproteobacteria bacterium]|jgi:molecular chaperone GrpE
MSKKKDENINDDIHSDSETEELEEPNEVSEDERITELEDTVLRLRAELDNSQKRSVAEIEKAHKYGIERLLLELLPVVDNLENALNNLSENVSESDKEGIDLTLKSFESALDKFGISPIYPISEDFDPINHEAVSVVKDEKHADNKIVEVMQKGWRLHERVIRPARVVVIKN